MDDDCEIARLPEELLSAALSRTAPRDACRAAAVSAAFRAAADSDAVWSCFLPRDLPPLADGELDGPPAQPPSKKRQFLRLSDRPVLLADGRTSMWLDKQTGAKCYMLSARSLGIAWGDTARYWRWIPLTDSRSRFLEGAELLFVCWLEIRGEIHSKMLSQDSTYSAYIVFKIADDSYGLDYPVQASVSIGERKSTRQVCIQDYGGEDEDEDWGENEDEVPHNYRRIMRINRRHRAPPPGASVLLPGNRDDGWMELELGEFCNEKGDDGVVSISLTETVRLFGKKGLIVQGIEIRAKK
ncbi:hypothetical protein ACP70R_027999 [Stipagrostis hirtigluma subsp. patula]